MIYLQVAGTEAATDDLVELDHKFVTQTNLELTAQGVNDLPHQNKKNKKLSGRHYRLTCSMSEWDIFTRIWL